MTRIINLESFNHPDERITAWLGANGIDPGDVPAAQEITIDGDKLTYLEFVREQTVAGAPPHKTMADDGNGWKKTRRTVTLISAPDVYGI